MKQVSYLSQIANRVRPRTDHPSGDQLMLNPPRLLFQQEEVTQTTEWAKETPLSDRAVESPLLDVVSLKPAPPQAEAVTGLPIASTDIQPPTTDIVSLKTVPSQAEAVTDLEITSTDTQPATRGILRATPDNQLPFKSLGVKASELQKVNKSATRDDINPQPGTVSLESAAIASPTPNLTPSLISNPPSRRKVIAEIEATDSRLPTTLEPIVQEAPSLTTEVANSPVPPLRTTLEPSPSMRLTRAREIAESLESSAPLQPPTVHIGAIEIQILPPPISLPTPRAKTVTRAAPTATGSLSRGFTSTFGLRQG
jgi:hypothetical protein